MINQYSRTELLIGSDGLEKLKNSRVAVFGVGGVGGFTVEALARSGVGTIDIIDNDTVSLTNINRQIIATHSTVGKLKVDVMKERIKDISPSTVVNKYDCFFLPENAENFDFRRFDYVVDAIDTVSGKIGLAEKFVSSDYTRFGKMLLDGFHNVRPGGRYVDFEVPDLEGNKVRLSDIIKGKIAVIDLWASWCMPCRAKAKAMIPIYEKYKDRGFEIVGVAREFKNTDRLKQAIKLDGYPWLQLVELDDGCRIWTQYMLGNAGGGVFLVDRDGKILAVNPKPEEVQKILEQKLGE